jgi:hypothetical protein
MLNYSLKQDLPRQNTMKPKTSLRLQNKEGTPLKSERDKRIP